jgi:hypothetical protein
MIWAVVRIAGDRTVLTQTACTIRVDSGAGTPMFPFMMRSLTIAQIWASIPPVRTVGPGVSSASERRATGMPPCYDFAVAPSVEFYPKLSKGGVDRDEW